MKQAQKSGLAAAAAAAIPYRRKRECFQSFLWMGMRRKEV
jgi:hypothetical protein